MNQTTLSRAEEEFIRINEKYKLPISNKATADFLKLDETGKWIYLNYHNKYQFIVCEIKSMKINEKTKSRIIDDIQKSIKEEFKEPKTKNEKYAAAVEWLNIFLSKQNPNWVNDTTIKEPGVQGVKPLVQPVAKPPEKLPIIPKKTFTKTELSTDAMYYCNYLEKLDPEKTGAKLLYGPRGKTVNLLSELSEEEKKWLAENKKDAVAKLGEIINVHGAGKKGFGIFRDFVKEQAVIPTTEKKKEEPTEREIPQIGRLEFPQTTQPTEKEEPTPKVPEKKSFSDLFNKDKDTISIEEASEFLKEEDKVNIQAFADKFIEEIKEERTNLVKQAQTEIPEKITDRRWYDWIPVVGEVTKIFANRGSVWDKIPIIGWGKNIVDPPEKVNPNLEEQRNSFVNTGLNKFITDRAKDTIKIEEKPYTLEYLLQDNALKINIKKVEEAI